MARKVYSNVEHMEKLIKILLSILFFICLLDMPYGYYQLVRWVALVGFAVLAYKSYQDEIIVLAIVYAGLAILFQPVFKIALGREVWNVVDVVVGLGLLVSVGYDFWISKRNKDVVNEM